MTSLPKILSPGQRRVLSVFRRLTRKLGGPPSIRGLAAELQVGIGPAYRHVRYLVRKGRLVEQPPPARGYTLPELVGGAGR